MKQTIIDKFLYQYKLWGYNVMTSDKDLLDSFEPDNTFTVYLFNPLREVAGNYRFQYVDGRFKNLGEVLV